MAESPLASLHKATVLRKGIYEAANFISSPNYDARPDGLATTLIVLHNISLPPGEFGGSGVQALFTHTLDPLEHPYYAHIAANRVSAHFFIQRGGQILQFVSCDQRAWHCGVSQWREQERCNDFSIGIELEGTDTQPFDSRQYASLIPLIRVLCANYPITAIAGHEHIAPGRKTDPGPFFDWANIRQAFPALEFPDLTSAQGDSP